MKMLKPLLISCLCVLAGCSMFSDDGFTKTSPFPFVYMAPKAPPTNLQEEQPFIESPGDEIWLPGYWAYNGSDFYWVNGMLVDRPDPTAVWQQPRWELRGYGWVFVPGCWQ